MRIDANFFCTVPMPDAGDPSVPATSRRYGMDAVLDCYRNLVAWAKTADQLGYDTMWLTEHHFQYEGYEVVPNLILFGLHLVNRTERLRLGQMFNVVPQWHPLGLVDEVEPEEDEVGDDLVALVLEVAVSYTHLTLPTKA